MYLAAAAAASQERRSKCHGKLSRLDWPGLALWVSRWRGASKPAFRASFSPPSRCATRTKRGAICRTPATASRSLPPKRWRNPATSSSNVCRRNCSAAWRRRSIERGKIFMPLSRRPACWTTGIWSQRAKETGARILVPTGALLGLDAVRAAAEGTIHSVTMITRKPPDGLEGAPYLVERGISVKDLKEPLKIFDGTAREGARGFPANVNVAAALSLAGIGPDKTRLEIWADPGADPQYPSHRGRCRYRALFDVDRRHPVGKSAHRPHRAAERDRGAARTGLGAESRHLTRWIERRAAPLLDLRNLARSSPGL